MPVAALIRLLAVLGVDAPSVRSSVSRLKRRGLLLPGRTADGAAGYALSEDAHAAPGRRRPPDLRPNRTEALRGLGPRRLLGPRGRAAQAASAALPARPPRLRHGGPGCLDRARAAVRGDPERPGAPGALPVRGPLPGRPPRLRGHGRGGGPLVGPAVDRRAPRGVPRRARARTGGLAGGPGGRRGRLPGLSARPGLLAAPALRGPGAPCGAPSGRLARPAVRPRSSRPCTSCCGTGARNSSARTSPAPGSTPGPATRTGPGTSPGAGSAPRRHRAGRRSPPCSGRRGRCSTPPRGLRRRHGRPTRPRWPRARR